MKTSKSKLILFVFLSLLLGCAPKKTTRSAPPSKEAHPEEPAVQEQDESVEGADSTPLPEEGPPAPKREPKIALVLGGVGVSSWATVGILKKFEEAEAKISCIVTTGWPTVFGLGYGFFRSIHDLEWFARRLEQDNFYKSGFLDFSKGYHDQDALKETLSKAFDERKALGQTRLPVWISASFPSESEPTIYRSGAWLGPALKTLSTPGIYKPVYTTQSDKKIPWGHSLVGVPVEEGRRCGADFVVAVDMYGDYLQWLGENAKKKQDSESNFRQLYVSQFRKLLQKEMQSADFSARIELKKSPLDFSSKLGAIRMGYEKAGEILTRVRSAELP